LCDARLGVGDLATPVVGAFLVARRVTYRDLLTAKVLVPLLGYLRGLGVAPQPESREPQTVAAVLLEGYRDWLLTERGLGVKVARGYVDVVGPFVAAYAVGGEAGLRELGAGEVTAFMIAQSRRLAPKTVQRLAECAAVAAAVVACAGPDWGAAGQAVPKVTNRRPGLPQPLDPSQVAALIASCDQATAAGRRDLAMLTLLARMGLRAGEVAGWVWTTSIGGAARSRSGGRETASMHSHCPLMSARPSQATCGRTDQPPPWTAVCLSALGHPTRA
jgi:integrase/recombinase XerD